MILITSYRLSVKILPYNRWSNQMEVINIVGILGIMFTPIYGGLAYLIKRERKNSRRIQGVINILDDEFEHISVEDEVPGTEGV